MAETFTRGGRRYVLYDLSDTLSNSTSGFEPNPHEVQYLDPDDGDRRGREALGHRRRGVARRAPPQRRLGRRDDPLRDARRRAAPLRADGGRRAGADDRHDAALLVLRPRRAARHALEDAEGRHLAPRRRGRAGAIGHELQEGDVVLVWTGTDLRQPGYQNASPGLRRDATEFLVDAGVHLIGIDAWGLDRPFPIMVEEAKAGELEQIWESHILGRTKPYAQIERMANLAELPGPTGYTVYAFPFKIEAAQRRLRACRRDRRGRLTGRRRIGAARPKR